MRGATRANWVVGVVCLVWGAGCAAPVSSDESDEGEGSDEEKLAAATQALGEPTCGVVPADAEWNGERTQQWVDDWSDVLYGQPGCQGGFVVDAEGLTEGQAIRAGGTVFNPNDFPCFAGWAYVSLWEKRSGLYWKVAERSGLGVRATTHIGALCDPRVTIVVPRDGDYRLVVASRFFAGIPLPISILWDADVPE